MGGSLPGATREACGGQRAALPTAWRYMVARPWQPADTTVLRDRFHALRSFDKLRMTQMDVGATIGRPLLFEVSSLPRLRGGDAPQARTGEPHEFALYSCRIFSLRRAWRAFSRVATSGARRV